MSERFFTSEPITGDTAMLSGTDAHHLAHVMRAEVGETVTLFDGTGCEYVARIQSIGKRAVELVVIERREVDRESAVKLTLAVALPKGERQRVLVEKAVELGVRALVPLETERGVAQPTSSVLDRLRRAVIEASKQCGRNVLMAIKSVEDWGNYCRRTDLPAKRWLAHPGGAPAHKQRGDLVVAIGPEGGFTDDEVAFAVSAGFVPVSLGGRVLRCETAALAALSVVQCAWGDL